MFKVNQLDKLSLLLVLIGAINWGTIGLININLVKLVSFGYAMLERIIYIVIFFAAIDLILLFFRVNSSN